MTPLSLSFPFQTTLAGRTLAVFLLFAFFALARPNGHHVNAQISPRRSATVRPFVRPRDETDSETAFC